VLASFVFLETLDGGNAGFFKAVSQKEIKPIGPWASLSKGPHHKFFHRSPDAPKPYTGVWSRQARLML
jgi:hypothetical protein